jgi:hypothetical protein
LIGDYYRQTLMSGVGHPRSNLVELLMIDGSEQYTGHRYCITGHSG